jgi:hypothetical protein
MPLSAFCTVSVLKALAGAGLGTRDATGTQDAAGTQDATRARGPEATEPVGQIRATAADPRPPGRLEPWRFAAALPQQLAIVQHRPAPQPSRTADAS